MCGGVGVSFVRSLNEGCGGLNVTTGRTVTRTKHEAFAMKQGMFVTHLWSLLCFSLVEHEDAVRTEAAKHCTSSP